MEKEEILEETPKEEKKETKVEYYDAGTVPEFAEFKKTKKTKPKNESCFDGKLLDTLAYTFLHIGITSITGTLGKPWADCIMNKYMCSHTIVNGKRLKFDGDPIELFVERFKWLLFSIITLGIYMIWVPVKKKRWELTYTHFEDEELVEGESYFTGTVLSHFGINLLCKLITGLTLGLLSPFSHWIMRNWTTNHSVINRKQLVYVGNPVTLFLKRLWWTFLSAITFGIYGIWFNYNQIKWDAENTKIRLKGDNDSSSNDNKTIEHKQANYHMNKGLLIGLIALIAVVLITIVTSIILFFKPSNPEVELELVNILESAQRELYNNPDYFYSIDFSKRRNDIKLLNLEAINNFVDQNGKGKYFLYLDEENGFVKTMETDDFYIQLTKGSTVCYSRVKKQQDEWNPQEILCQSKSRYWAEEKHILSRSHANSGNGVEVYYRD